MPTISVCCLVKNEERNVRDLIHSFLPMADEFLIADTGSSDDTIGIIEELVAVHKNIKLYHYVFEEPFHFGKARNFLLDRVSKEYAIMIDADERPTEEFIEHIRGFLQTERPRVAGVIRKDEIVPHLIDEFAGRIIRTDSHIRYGTGPSFQVHENLVYAGEVSHFHDVLWHNQRWNHHLMRPQRMLFQLELQIDRTPKTKSFFGHFRRGVWYFFFRFNNLYFKRKLYQDGILGFKYSFLRGLDAFLIQFFVGLKPTEGSIYWKED